MLLSQDQRFTLGMKMLSIVERLMIQSQQPAEIAPPKKLAEEDSSHDDELNAIIREQLNISDSKLMDSEE